jgi:hypothetical protein
VSFSAPTRGAVGPYEHPGLFAVPLDRPQATSAAAMTVEPPAMRPRRRVTPTVRQRGGLRRYCSGCAHETQHVPSASHGHGSTPSIRWPAADPECGTTTCLTCGQWRAASSRPSPPAWSMWPRTRIATRRLADPVARADTADDWAPETAAENEGMPPKPEPRLRTGDTSVHRLHPLAPSRDGAARGTHRSHRRLRRRAAT